MTNEELAAEYSKEIKHLEGQIDFCRDVDPGNNNPAVGLRRKMFEGQVDLVRRKLKALYCPTCNEGRLISIVHEDKGGRLSLCAVCAHRKYPTKYPNPNPQATIIADYTSLKRKTILDLDRSVATAREKHTDNGDVWLAVLVEEVGEMARAIYEGEGVERVRAEALDIATVAMRIFEEYDE